MTDTTEPTRLPTRRRRWTTWVLAVVIFLGGMVCGAGLTAVVAVKRIQHAIRHPEEAPARITNHLARRLDLTDQQKQQVHDIVARRHGALVDIRREVWPRVELEIDAMRGEISQVLDDRQRAKWDQLFEHAQERWLPPPPPAREQ